ncbi:glycerate kinase [Streptococcus parauberis]|uniref:glycerate kinase n=1 Tax=Streptococcus parauberis TaxID=1348 RepID=UPI0039C2D827
MQLKRKIPCERNSRVKILELADGGEGSLTALEIALGGEFIPVETVDLLNRDIIAPYLLVDDTAFIEVAQVVGIDKIRTNMEPF